MLRSSLLAFAIAACASAEAQTLPQASEVMQGLGGSCWKADLGEGVTDMHCFTFATGGLLVMDVHKVRNRSGAVVYEGATLYRLEKVSGVVRYDYFNSMGDLLSGYAKRDGPLIRFSEKADETGDLVWYLGPDAYEVGTVTATAATQRFVRAGPAEPGGL